MRVEIDVDEKWPIFSLSHVLEQGGVGVEIPDEFVERFLEVQEEYEIMQNKIKEIYDVETAKSHLRNDLQQDSDRIHAAS